jgi:two-component system, OmpR family, sensor histidine kinase RstB
MRRLYLRIYLAVLVSLAIFALATALLWHRFGHDGPAAQALEVAATLARNVLPPADAPKAAQQAALERLAADLRADVALFGSDRSLLASVGAPPPAPEEGRRGAWKYRWDGGPVWRVRLSDGRWLAARATHSHRFAGYRLFLLIALLAFAVGIGAYPVARRLTRRLERLQAGVESLGSGDLSARAKIEGKDEVARLAASFNRAAGRIEELVGTHKALLANASHELRTPLARIRMAVELMKEDADPKRKAELERDIAEIDALIEEILLASRLDAVKHLERTENVDLLALAAEECARYENADLEGRPASVHGAPPIVVRMGRTNSSVELSVCDHGAGIAEAERERVFEPFYRRGTGQGSGLGLALVRQIARQHGGDARCVEGKGRTACIVISLPAVP